MKLGVISLLQTQRFFHCALSDLHKLVKQLFAWIDRGERSSRPSVCPPHLLNLISHVSPSRTACFSSSFVCPAPYLIISFTCHFLGLQLTHLFSLPQYPAYNLQPSRTRMASRIGCTCLGSHPHSSAPQTQSGTALPCTWRQAARKEGPSGVGAAVTLVPPARQKAPWGQGLGLPVLWSPQDRALPTVGDQSCWLPDRGMDWMTYEVTLSLLTLLYNHDTSFRHFVVLAPPTSQALLCLSASAHASFWNVIFFLLYLKNCNFHLSRTQFICHLLCEAFPTRFPKQN